MGAKYVNRAEVDQYRRYARLCQIEADRAKEEFGRLKWRSLQVRYERLAEHAAKLPTTGQDGPSR